MLRARETFSEGLLGELFFFRIVHFTHGSCCNIARLRSRDIRTLFYCNINVYIGYKHVIDYKYINIYIYIHK